MTHYPPKQLVFPRQIITKIAQEYGVGYDDLMGTIRLPVLVEARYKAVNTFRVLGFSQVAIARILKRDRTTIRHYFKVLNRGRRIAECDHLGLVA